MNVKDRLVAYLGENEVPYLLQHHPQAFTAEEVAASEHVRGKMMAKVVMVIADGKMALFVLTANDMLDLAKVAYQLDAQQVRLAEEAEFKELFADCEVGAMPPFGNLYGLPVYVDETVAENQFIVFQAGTHTDSIKIPYASFAHLVKPLVANFKRQEDLSFIFTVETSG